MDFPLMLAATLRDLCFDKMKLTLRGFLADRLAATLNR